MTRIFAACLVAAAALAAPGHAAADPQDLLPYCSGDQSPIDTDCRPMPHQAFTDDATGADPNVALGTDPGEQPVV